MLSEKSWYPLAHHKPSMYPLPCKTHTEASDPTINLTCRHQKVKASDLNCYIHSISLFISDRHTNAMVNWVYKYPPQVLISIQFQSELSSIPVNKKDTFVKKSFLCSENQRVPYILFQFLKNVRLGLKIFNFCLIILPLFSISAVNSLIILFVISGVAMTSSPRPVLDRSFQCEAQPICVEERSSSSLLQALNRTLAGKLLAVKRPSVMNLSMAVSRLWNCMHRLRCFDHGKCLYSFEFTSVVDVEKVLSGGPWYVNGDLLIISRMNPNQSIEQLSFSSTKLWVRCYDLPPKCFTKEYAEAIGNSLGKFSGTDLPSDDPEEAKLMVQTLPTVRKYLRVKFEFNLSGPLKSSQSIKICNKKKEVVEEHLSRLTYERLPFTCFRCGFVGHLLEDCSFDGPLLYGEWIRAEKFYKINSQSVSIPKTVHTTKETQASSSQRAVVQVSNVAELVNNMVNDPGIMKANFSQVRAEGLPPSKGKSPLVSPNNNNRLVPYASASQSKSSSPTTVYGPSESVLGSIPSFLRSHSSPIGNDTILIDSDEGQFVSFLNSITTHEEGFPTNPNRCLFNMDHPLPDNSTEVKGMHTTSETNIADSAVPAPSAGLLSNVFKEEIKKLPVGRKRVPGNPQTPRPKRGRQPPGADTQA